MAGVSTRLCWATALGVGVFSSGAARAYEYPLQFKPLPLYRIRRLISRAP